MPELEKRIGLLRLLLADVQSKQAQLAEMENQYRTQLARVVEFVVYREGDVGNALSLMTDVQSKLDEVVRTGEHLGMILDKANLELEALVLTKRVAEARSQLATLEERRKELSARLDDLPGGQSGEARPVSAEASEMEDLRAINDEVAHEIARLNNLITEASERAARTIQSAKGGVLPS
ncbi:MAG TPA: hypothetical protein VEX13_07260 [Chloroflexia bacterium]|nr:hypothetical protein [Chloroflexia bacterium]